MQKIGLIVLLLLGISFAYGLQVNHIPPVGNTYVDGTDIVINILEGFGDISKIEIHYRGIDSGNYETSQILLPAAPVNLLTFRLPNLDPKYSGYEYYIEITRKDGGIQTLPANAPSISPYRVKRAQAEVGDNPFVMLSPSGPVGTGEDLIIAVSLYSLADELDMKSIQIVVNGNDVTSRADITDGMILYRQSRPRSGQTSYQIIAAKTDGTILKSPLMTVDVVGSGLSWRLPLNIRGNYTFINNIRSRSADNLASPDTDNDDAQFLTNLYGGSRVVSFKARLLLSTLEKETKQAVNRYMFGVDLPHLELIAGDYAPYISSFTVSNQNIRGFHGRVHFSGFELLSSYGETMRAIDGSEVSPNNFTSGTFKRDALAVRIQAGRAEGTQFGLNFIKNKDKVSSLDRQYYLNADSSAIVTPKDNIVLSLDGKVSSSKQRVTAGAEVAVSYLNNNTLDGAISKEELEDYMGQDLPININPQDFDNIFILNKNVEPFLPSRANVAFQVYARSFFLGNYISVNYSQVGASYHSLSANFLQNDTKVLSITDNINIKNVLFIDAGLSQVADNLSDQKTTTNSFNTFYAQMMLQLKNMPYFRLGYNLNTGKDDQAANEQTLNQASTGMTFGVGYHFANLPVAPTRLDVTYGTTNDKDKSIFKSYNIDNNLVNLNLTSRFIELPLTTTISLSMTNNSNKRLGTTQTTISADNKINQFGLRGEYRLLEDKLTPYVDFRANTLGGDQDKQSYQYVNLGTGYSPWSHTSMSTDIGFKMYDNSDMTDVNYSSITWSYQITQRF